MSDNVTHVGAFPQLHPTPKWSARSPPWWDSWDAWDSYDGTMQVGQTFYPAFPQIELKGDHEGVVSSTEAANNMSTQQTSETSSCVSESGGHGQEASRQPINVAKLLLSIAESGGFVGTEAGTNFIGQSFYPEINQPELRGNIEQVASSISMPEATPCITLPPHINVSSSDHIPRLEWGKHHGRLVELLSICGAVFLDVRTLESHGDSGITRWPDAQFERWSALLDEARASRAWFNARPCVEHRMLRLSGREDLKRTLDGADKLHTPDQRIMFGFSDRAMKATWVQWDDLAWVPTHYAQLKSVMLELINSEVAPLCAGECGSQANSLGSRIWWGCEKWSQSALRHCMYPFGGSCTEHTDYGVLTLQHCTCPGLEVSMNGTWCPVQPPEGSVVLFAGDMLERLTNGKIKALLHRVCMDSNEVLDSVATNSIMHRSTARQSHIFFLQPDRDTIVCPLAPFRSGNTDDLPPVQYGKWHQEKVSLAFGHGQTLAVRPPPRVIPPPERGRSRSQRKSSSTNSTNS